MWRSIFEVDLSNSGPKTNSAIRIQVVLKAKTNHKVKLLWLNALQNLQRGITPVFSTQCFHLLWQKSHLQISHLRLRCKKEMAWNFCQARMNILVPYLSTCWQKLWDLISNQSCYYQIFSLVRWMILRPEKQRIRKNLSIANLWFVGSLTLLYFNSLPIQNTHLVLTGKP